MRYRFSDITINYDSRRVPLSAKQRKERKGKYPYYGAQGVIDYIDDYIFDGKYLLIAEDGENLKSKKQKIAQLATGRYWVNNHAHIVQTNEKCLIEYLYYIFNITDISGYITGSAQPKLSQANLNAIEIEIPSLKQQKKIVEVLSALDNKIELNQKINDNLYQQLDAIYRAMYPFLPSEELPEGWKCIPLGRLCDSISTRHSFDKEKLIFLNTGDIDNGQFLHSTYSLVQDMPGQAKKSIRTNDILYSEIRPINRHFAFVNFEADDYVVSTKLMVIRSHEMDSRRLYHFLTTQDVINELQIEAESRSGTFPQIRFENIQRLPIIIAPPDVELQFAQILKDYYNMIDNNIFENQYLIALRDSILPKLMSGEIDVEDVKI